MERPPRHRGHEARMTVRLPAELLKAVNHFVLSRLSSPSEFVRQALLEKLEADGERFRPLSSRLGKPRRPGTAGGQAQP